MKSIKRLAEVLYFTKNIEECLHKLKPNEISLSDKIKAFEDLNPEDFENEYEYREYKRNLLDGYYNDLRYIAHERNQIMHQHDYTIPDYASFKKKMVAALRYFGKDVPLKYRLTFNDILSFLFYFIPLFIGYFLLTLFIFKNISIDYFIENFINGNYSLIALSVIVILGIFSLFYFIGKIILNIVQNLLMEIFYVFYTVYLIIIHNEVLFINLTIAYFLFRKHFHDSHNLFHYYQCILTSLTQNFSQNIYKFVDILITIYHYLIS